MPDPVQAAEFVGVHSTAFFVSALLGLLGTICLLWWAHGRYARPQFASRLSAQSVLMLRIGLGFAVILAAASVFAELAEWLGVGHSAGEFDDALARTIGASAPQPMLQFFAWLTRLGNTSTLAVLCVVVSAGLLFMKQRLLTLGWIAAVAGNAVLNTSLKAIFARVRPLHDGLIQATGFSFPSGHSSGSVVAYGMLAYVLMRARPEWERLPFVLAAAALAFSIGCSRIFLQVHFASDVLAGFASGSAWLVLCISSVEVARHLRGSQPR
ncbi:MAG: phosphatase PAP2 family protein [Pseudomonadota bacterium]